MQARRILDDGGLPGVQIFASGSLDEHAIAALLEDEQVLAYEFEGRRYDCGNKLDYLLATVEYGLRHEEMGEQFRCYLESLICGGDASG